MGIVLRLGPRSENTVELLRFQPTIRGGGEIMIVKDTLIFPKIVEVCESV